MSNRAQFMTAVLVGLGAPVTTDNVDALVAQSDFEFGTQNPVACAFNPLATTLQTPGAISDCNSVGVKNYRDFQAGVDATVATYRINAYGYPAVVAALRANAGAEAVIAAISASQWGSKPSAAHLNNVRTRRDFFYGLTLDGVAGPTDVPVTPNPPTPPPASVAMMESEMFIGYVDTLAGREWWLMDALGTIRQLPTGGEVFGVPKSVADLRGDPPQFAVIHLTPDEFNGFGARRDAVADLYANRGKIADVGTKADAIKAELDALKSEAEAGYPTLQAIAAKVGATTPGAALP